MLKKISLLDLQRNGVFMEKYIEVLKNVELFGGIDSSDLNSLLFCLSAKAQIYEKGQLVFASGDEIHSFGIVLSGQVQVYSDDYYGNRSILSRVNQGGLFGESFACAETKSLPVSVFATTESELLFIDCRKLESPCTNACGFHSRLIHNMMTTIAKKNVVLTQKIEITSKRTTREKLLSYLSAEAQKAKSSSFLIPFDRQALSDYLSVDRSAMSSELCKLRDEGIVRFNKNQFELLT